MTVLEIPTAGTALRAPGRPDAWSILGTGVQGARNASEALDLAHLSNWNVRVWDDVNVTRVDETGVTSLKMSDTRATVRTNPLTQQAEYVGTVGTQYTPVQIDDHEDVLDMFGRESGATFHKAGAYGKNGSKFFVSMVLPEVIRIGGFDEHRMHLTLFGSHDGSSANSFHIGPTRLDCGNMQRFIIAGAQHKYSIPHTVSAPTKIREVHKALATLFDWQAAFEREANRLLNTPLTLEQFEKVASGLWDSPATKRQLTNYEARMSTLRALFLNADTQESIRGTAWAGWNAIGEYLDHHGRANSAALRAARSLSDTGAVTGRKTSAFNQLFALAA
ncbi:MULTISPECIES: DUF932 domain-containing protein [unclassified Streptomyces]|uniref:DUF932 domain-containing protein n=1 Tax=unclassified Streptomyces TaxID=2593676 RepID=UPI00224F7B89|nr:DUF932 domain-containing protein [Streptomyces sp. NBC_01264]MCX4784109.1 DUF945 domain-containing protein [Streptomyces sp. NBC_01264]